jgi:hypothetical protein
MLTFSARFAPRVLLATVLAVTPGACKEFTSIDASYPNATNSETLYALNGAPPGAANAMKFFDGIANRADQGFAYDVAFDINADGDVVVIPSKALATGFSNPYSVGLQSVSGSFESVTSAPKDGYRADTAMTVHANQVFVIESRDQFGTCAYSLKGQSYYSKVVITAIDVEHRRIDMVFTVNKNCGFRSFAPGIPRD